LAIILNRIWSIDDQNKSLISRQKAHLQSVVICLNPNLCREWKCCCCSSYDKRPGKMAKELQ